MFVGREHELQKLNELWRGGKFQCVVMYGRRRVGKTALISEFIKDKPAIFFTGLETNGAENLKNLSRAVFEFDRRATGEAPIYTDFSSALEAAFHLAVEKRLVLVIDEFPYLERSHKGISSILQSCIDKLSGNSKLFLVLCGSSMSFMEEQVLGYKSPLYGRRTAQFKITPFDFFNTARYFKKFSMTDLLAIYAITGGIPHYLAQMDENISVRENMINNFFTPSSFLFEEPSNLLKQEMREPALYNAIISAIASGSSRSSEISSKAAVSSSVFATYVANLISLGIVKKEAPITEESSRKTIYSIDDGMFRFWYRFVPDNIAAISNGMGARAFQRIEPQIPAFLGQAFEKVCSEYLWMLNARGETPLFFSKLGRWWGNNPIEKRQEEIDILAFADKRAAIFGECKWTEEKVGAEILDRLMERSRILGFKDCYYYVFAKSGFRELKKKLGGNIRLVSFAEMV